MPATIEQRDLFSATTTSCAPSANAGAITLLDQVRRAFERAGPRGFTDEELHAEICVANGKRKEGSVRGRRCELLAAGEIADSGQRRLSVAGVESTVWTVPRFIGDPASIAPVAQERDDPRDRQSAPPTALGPANPTSVSAGTGDSSTTRATTTAGPCHAGPPWRHEPHERITFDGYIRTECARCGEVLLPDHKAEFPRR